MKIFICNRSTDIDESIKTKNELLEKSSNSIAILQEIEHSQNWKTKVEKKLQEVDFIVFLLGHDTFQSENLIYELNKAKEINKPIVCIKLSKVSDESINFCEGFQIFSTAEQCLDYLNIAFEKNQKLLLEQYKIMVTSTEKVTEQRLKVNNLFFTVTSSILSVAFVVGKTLEFSIPGIIGMFFLTLMAFLASFFWEKLINSYGNLNKGKFMIVDKLEKQLRTNMFEEEWQILTEKIKYEPNSRTEVKIVENFRVFILIVGMIELLYLGYKVCITYPTLIN